MMELFFSKSFFKILPHFLVWELFFHRLIKNVWFLSDFPPKAFKMPGAKKRKKMLIEEFSV